MSGRVTLRQKFKAATTHHGAKIHATRIASVEYHRRNTKCIYTRVTARLLIAIAVALHTGDWQRAKRLYASPHCLPAPMPEWIRDVLRAP